MPIYKAWVPVYASVLYTLETEEAITDPAELRERILNEGESCGSLCDQCANHIELDPANSVDGCELDVIEES